ncbi:hypothetical protein HELRODRAFT_165056 [Helobdella robusta]|uniref:Uncharacterized protein n=1 Tax=Helobdella robusta TaxID=6412 RepID=T1EW79_HELRO|nr:hypothetical protein HELRODRAFT_165056 [Helobdella robusta]ESN92920.1 hypothetical protein HELRODRAFT_165056 [Helobdella robusta]
MCTPEELCKIICDSQSSSCSLDLVKILSICIGNDIIEFSTSVRSQFCHNLLELTDIYLNKRGCIDGITIENGKISWMQTAKSTIFSGRLEVPNDDVKSHDYTNTNDSEYESTLDDDKFSTESIKNVHVIKQSPHLLGFTYLRDRLIWIDQNRLHVASEDSTSDDFVKTILINDNVKYVSMVTADKDIYKKSKMILTF